MNAVVKEENKLIKLDIGCGPNPRAGFVGVDSLDFGKPDIVKHDLRISPWPFEDNSVTEAHCAHFLEHLTNLDGKWERVRFFNELWRVMAPATYNQAGQAVTGIATIIMPHWASHRHYGDPTHKEPFGEMGICYLDPVWRKANAPHTDSEFNPDGYNCNFACNYNYSLHQGLNGRNQEFVNFAATFFKEAIQDVTYIMTCIKK